MIVLRSTSPAETKEIGRRLGETLKMGDTVLLDGELGAGKTVFVSGIAEALGYSGYITSPTYTLVNEYRDLKLDLFHMDAYRIENPDDIIGAGFDEYLGSNGVKVVEWAKLIGSYAPPDSIRVSIEKSGQSGQSGQSGLDGDVDGRTISIWGKPSEKLGFAPER